MRNSDLELKSTTVHHLDGSVFITGGGASSIFNQSNVYLTGTGINIDNGTNYITGNVDLICGTPTVIFNGTTTGYITGNQVTISGGTNYMSGSGITINSGINLITGLDV